MTALQKRLNLLGCTTLRRDASPLLLEPVYRVAHQLSVVAKV
jgi:hypothetical protein